MSAANVVHYAIWHLDTGNLIRDYPTEAAALRPSESGSGLASDMCASACAFMPPTRPRER